MEYTVGSVADLISGSDTPNKRKIVKQELNKFQKSKIQQGRINKSKKNDQNINKLKKTDRYFNMKLSNKANNSKPNKKIKIPIEGSSKISVSKTNTIESEDDENEEDTFKSLSDTDSSSDDESEAEQEQKPSVNKEVNSRTIFVGNVPVTIKKRQLERYFHKFGQVQSVRLRCVAPAKPGMSKRVAVIKKLIHPKRLTMHSYVTFEKREDAIKALQVNGTKFKEHHLRVQLCDKEQETDPNKAIFLGNVPFDVEDEDLWNAFESCGSIDFVRIIRDAKTNMGIGIAYVNFKSPDSVELALQMGSVMIKNKEARILRYSKQKKNKKLGAKKRGKFPHKNKERPTTEYKRPRNYPGLNEENNPTEDKQITKSAKKKARDGVEFAANVAVRNGVFQGTKSTLKKKKPKLNKGFIQKMKLKSKIAPR